MPPAQSRTQPSRPNAPRASSSAARTRSTPSRRAHRPPPRRPRPAAPQRRGQPASRRGPSAGRRPAARAGGRPPAPAWASSPLVTTLQGLIATLVAGLAPALRRARPGRRLGALLALYLLLTVFIGWRLVSVQVLAADEYRGLAQRQTHRDLAVPAPRGKLYDRSGQPLAMSLSAATVYANPRQLRGAGIAAEEVAAQLAPLVDRPADELTRALARDASFVYLGRQLPRPVGDQVEALELPGVGVIDEPTRAYPSDGLAAQVVGFAGIDHSGLSGLESHYDEVLAGRAGRVVLERAPGGLTISAAPRELSPPVAGEDLVLTLDRQIQHAVERALVEAVETYDAKGASAVILDAKTGEILAMASAPGYTSETAGSADAYARRNRVVTDVVEPGSVNKVITMAAALEEDLVEPDTIFSVADSYTVGPKRFTDAHGHATKPMTAAEIMVASSNVGTIQIAERVGTERLHHYLREFGYGSLTGVGFPGETAGLLAAPEDWTVTSLPTIAIGHGVSATLLQVANVYGVVANDGEWSPPTLIRGRVADDGKLQPARAEARRRVVSPQTAQQIREMLAGVVYAEGGTGKRAAIPGYTVAGKTGTAQKPSETRRGYEAGKYVGSFAGYAPADDPALIAAVMVDEPTPIYGGLTAAPVFSEIMEFALAHQRVVPTGEPDEDGPDIPTATPPEDDDSH